MSHLLLVLALGAVPSPLTLDQALQLARQNPQIAQAQSLVTQAQGQVAVARSGFLPTASAYASVAGTTLNPGPQPSSTFYPLYGANITLTQTLWDFGRTLGSYQAARDLALASSANVDATWQSVELSVRTAYYSVLGFEAAVDVARQTVDSFQKALDLAQGQYDVGTRPKSDVAKAQSDLDSAKYSLLQAQTGVIQSRISLSQVVGQDLGNVQLAPPELPPPGSPDATAEFQKALKGRPDLRSAEFQVLAANEGLDAAKSAWYPILGVQGTVRWAGTDTPLVNNYTITGTLTWPFLNGGADLGRVESSRGQVQQAQAQRDLLLLQVRADVDSAVAGVIQSSAARESAKSAAASAKETLELQQGRYQAGLGTILDLSNAQSQYADGQLRVVNANFDLATAWARLKKATGE
jgi:outer membrane protein